jgi:hypothetical protein
MTPVHMLPLNDPDAWPLRMTLSEVAHVSRRSARTLQRRILAGRFPAADSDGCWARATVRGYLEGGIQKFDDLVDRRERQQQLAVVRRGGSR